jgi:hypothetical protein
MAGRTLQELIDESRELEELGSRIQGEHEPGLSNEKVADFVTRYHSWFADALAALPAEFHERFRDEYAGGFFSAKIKSFLEAPTQVSALYNESEPSPLVTYWQNPFDTTFRGPLLSQRQILLEGDRLRQTTDLAPEALQLVERVCRGVPTFLYPLTKRARERPDLAVEDEYDLQDLLHGLLRIFFEDVRPEETSPSRGGSGSRLDFLLKRERIVVEAKMTRSGRGAKQIGEEIIVDVEKYRAHPDCRVLVVCVYDPTRQISNPHELTELEQESEDLVVRVIVTT